MKLSVLIANILSPPRCVFCGRAVDVRKTHKVCAGCGGNLPYNDGKRCMICGTPLDIVCGDLYCAVCRHNKRSFAQNVSRFVYKGHAADALRHMKFGKGQLWIADTLGTLLAETVKNEYGDLAFDLVLSVPISKKRLRERGFNQAEIIADSVCKSLDLKRAGGVLTKPKDTPKQSSMNYEKRKANVRGAFTVKKPDCIVDKTLLLIDDICTTGSTLNECSKVLKKAGAAVVYCATVATTALK